MKRLLLLVLAGIMVVAAGCGSGKVEEEVVTTEEVTAAESTTTEEAMVDEYPLGNGKMILYSHTQDYMSKILLRDESGKETVLLEPHFPGKNINAPVFQRLLNERFFVFCWAIPESCGVSEDILYDIELKKEIDLEFTPFDPLGPFEYEFLEFANGSLRYQNVYDKSLLKIDLKQFEITLP